MFVTCIVCYDSNGFVDPQDTIRGGKHWIGSMRHYARMPNSVGKVFLAPDDKAAWKSCVRKRMGYAIKVRSRFGIGLDKEERESDKAAKNPPLTYPDVLFKRREFQRRLEKAIAVTTAASWPQPEWSDAAIEGKFLLVSRVKAALLGSWLLSHIPPLRHEILEKHCVLDLILTFLRCSCHHLITFEAGHNLVLNRQVKKVVGVSSAAFWPYRRIGTAPTKTTPSARSSGKDVATRLIMLRTHPLPSWLGEWLERYSHEEN